MFGLQNIKNFLALVILIFHVVMSGTDSDARGTEHGNDIKYVIKRSHRFDVKDYPMSQRRLNPLTAGHDVKKETGSNLQRRHDEYANEHPMLEPQFNMKTKNDDYLKLTVNGHVQKKDTDEKLEHDEFANDAPMFHEPGVTTEVTDYDYANNDGGKLTFRPLLHQPRIYYGAPPGVHVTTIHAYDPEKPRKKVEYSLPDILDYDTFIIDQSSGNLTTAKHIAKELNQTYEVMVAAVSAGSSELEHIQIVVTEFNQYAPRFDKRNYTIDVHPKTDVNKTVLQVRATDPDPKEENAEIFYKMDQNSTSKYFNLNYVTGDLILIQPINESGSTLCFGIFAEDGGSPKRWDYVPVYIHLKNISAPLHVQVLDITHASASVCWEEPLYGDVLGYTISYSSDSHVAKTVNVTVDYDVDVCHSLFMLDDDTEYKVQVHGWNEYEIGQLSQLVDFKTAKNYCKSKFCLSGSCETLSEEPWFICNCDSGFHGPLCELFNPCVSDPCGSDGVCHNTSNNEYKCVCNEDYYGFNCNFYDPCKRSEDFCKNGGTCTTTVDKMMTCICPEGFSGRQCNHTEQCFTNSCLHGGICQQVSDKSISCVCPPGFEGELCEFEIKYCDSNPCPLGSTCINNRDNYTCVCPPAYFGMNCTDIRKCAEEETFAMDVWYTWNETKVGHLTFNNCPFGAKDSLSGKGYVKRSCLIINGTAVWGEIDVSECKTKENILVSKITIELQNITKNPESLNADSFEAAAEGIITAATYTTDKKAAQDVVDVISNVLDVNDSVLEQTEDISIDFLLESIDVLVMNIELEPGERLNLNSGNVRIESLDWHPDEESDVFGEYEMFREHIELTAPMFRGIDDEKETEKDEDSKIYPSTTSPSIPDDSLSPNITSTTKPPNVTEGTITPTSNVTGTTQKPKLPVFQVFVPKEVMQEAHRQLEKSVRLKFVVYYNNKLFQPKKTQKDTEEPVIKVKKKESASNDSITTEELPIKVPVLQISVGNIALKNLQKPLVYILPMVTSRKATCVFWIEGVRQWSTEGLETEQTFDKVICKSSHMTAFSVLLDLDPTVTISELDDTILSILSYVGSGMSIVGLSITLLTYTLFKCLNRDHTGQILINLCFSLLMMNVAFLTGSSSLINTRNACGIIAILIHYFVMSSLAWMCVEAANMYQLLVHVFASAETHFMLKRMMFAWGTPLIIVCATAVSKFDAYRQNPDACVMSSYYPWIYYSTFMAPNCVLLLLNLFVFLRVSRVIFTPKLTVRASHSRTSRVTPSQVRGAFTVMILLGTTWVFGTLSFGRAKIIFSYLFCITNSLQGFLIFIVRCLLYPEAKNAWVYLFKTGKFKTHRGVLPPGTVSYNSNSGFRSGMSPNTTTGRTDSSDDRHSSGFNRASKTLRTSPRTTSFIKQVERHPCAHSQIRRSPVHRSDFWNERNQFYRHDISQRQSRYDSLEMQRRCDRNNEYNTFQWRSPYSCPSPSRQRQTEATVEDIASIEFQRVNLKKKHNIDANKRTVSRKLQAPRKDISRSVEIPRILRESRDTIPEADSPYHKGQKSRKNEESASPDDLLRKNTIFGDVKNITPQCSSSNSRRKYIGKQKALPKGFCLDVDEGVHSEGSSSTDVDDVLSHASKHSPINRKK